MGPMLETTRYPGRGGRKSVERKWSGRETGTRAGPAADGTHAGAQTPGWLGSDEITCGRCHQIVAATYATVAGAMCEACRKDWWHASHDAPPSHEEAAEPVYRTYAECQVKHCEAPAIATAEKPGCYRLQVCARHAEDARERGLTVSQS